jgi:hypothetical protein
LSNLAEVTAKLSAKVRARINSAATQVRKAKAEILVACAIVGGWASLTSAVAIYIRPAVTWRVSIAVLLFSLAGWRFVGRIVSQGLYKLSRD